VGGSGWREGHAEEVARPWAVAARGGCPGMPAGAPAYRDWQGRAALARAKCGRRHRLEVEGGGGGARRRPAA
jgi:hypothetical protein